MTTLVVVKKGRQVAMACDTLVTFGDTRLSQRFEANAKVFRVRAAGGDTLVGLAGTVAHLPALQRAMKTLPRAALALHSRADIFDTFVRLHPVLKEQFFLQTKEEDADPYESSQFSVLLANGSGIFGVYSYREVFEFKQFWGIGSGRAFALGAMHAGWSRAKSARELALAGVAAACEFDKSSAGPAEVFTLSLKDSP